MEKIKRNDYRKSLKGMIGRMYYYMHRRVSGGIPGRSYRLYNGLDIMDQKEFCALALKHRQLRKLYGIWKSKGYQLNLRPTPHRKNSDIGYTWANIQFTQYRQNCSFAGKKKKRHVN